MTTTRDLLRTAGMATTMEHRSRPLGDAMVRKDTEDSAPRFRGHAAVFDSRAEIGDPLKWGWYESISPGAFDKTLAEGDARFLVDHDTSLLVARVSAGDLRLSTDGVGLAVDADLDQEVTYVRDLVRNLEARRITGMSFGFYVVRDSWTEEEKTVEDADGKAHTFTVLVRTISEVRLLEVSAVTFPAYEDTDADLAARCAEVRARLSATDSPPAPAGVPAPPIPGTRGHDRHAERAAGLRARYRLDRKR